MNSVDRIMFVLFMWGVATLLMYVSGRIMLKNMEHTLEESMKRMEEGECPVCHSVHPEAASHTGNNNFWTTFHCPECKYNVTAHIKHPNEIR